MLTAAAGNAAIRGNRFFAVHPYRPDRAKGGAYAAALAPLAVDVDHQESPFGCCAANAAGSEAKRASFMFCAPRFLGRR